MSLLVALPLVVSHARRRDCSCSRNGDAMPLTLGHAGCEATLIRIPHGGHAVIATLCPPRYARVLGGPRGRVGVMTTVVGLGTGIKGQQGKPRLGGQGQYIRDLVQLVLGILQRISLAHRRCHGFLVQLANVIVLGGESFLTLLKIGIGSSVWLAK